MLTDVLLPASLFIIMLGMGMTLTISDFSRVILFPKAAILGLVNQLILLPIIAFSLAVLFKLDMIMAVGLMAVACAPGGATTNLVTQVCKGNIALSVTLTAVASFISLITIPLILSKSLSYFGAKEDIVIKLPILQTMLQVMVITVIPISLGMGLRKLNTAFAMRMEKPMRIASVLIFAAIFVGIILENYDQIRIGIVSVGLVTLLLNLSTMGIGYLGARLFKLSMKNAVTISIESGIQNGTLSFVIVTTILKNVEMGVPVAVYAIWMFLSAGVLMGLLGTKKADLNQAPV